MSLEKARPETANEHVTTPQLLKQTGETAVVTNISKTVAEKQNENEAHDSNNMLDTSEDFAIPDDDIRDDLSTRDAEMVEINMQQVLQAESTGENVYQCRYWFNVRFNFSLRTSSQQMK